MIEPFTTKDIVEIRVARFRQDLEGFHTTDRTQHDVQQFLESGGPAIAIIDYSRTIIKLRFVAPYAIESTVRNIISSYGTRLRKAVGVPKTKVTIQLWDTE